MNIHYFMVLKPNSIVNKHFETMISNLYVGGDGAGITRGLAQAGANGVAIARSIIEKETK